MNIWFNNSSFEDPFEREELQIDGLANNFWLVSNIIRTEAQELSLNKVFLGGISQGCAMALHVLLGFDASSQDPRPQLGGFIGMSCWLPFQGAISDLISPDDQAGEDLAEHPFASESDDGVEIAKDDAVSTVARFIREDIMDISAPDPELLVCRRTPIFLGHGNQDDVVELDHGKNAATSLQRLGFDVVWMIYDEQGHWFKEPQTIDDITIFLEKTM
jgi:predicted esterase